MRIIANIRTINTSFVCDAATDLLIVSALSADITVTLPSATQRNGRYIEVFKSTTAKKVTVSPGGVVMSGVGTLRFVASGGTWYAI